MDFSPKSQLKDSLISKKTESEVSQSVNKKETHPLTIAGKSFKEELKNCTPIAEFSQSECCDIAQVGNGRKDNAIYITRDKYTLIIYD